MLGKRVIGVDLGGTKILAGVVDREGAVDRSLEVPTPVSSQEALLAALDDAVGRLLGDDVGALGFGIPSTIDQRAGRAVSSVNIPLRDLNLRARMRERFGLPAAIDNDANAATLAEWAFGAGRGVKHLIMLTLGTGIGGGLILDGRVYRGAVGAGAEIGHMVLDYEGEPCRGTCTGRGHFEALASGRAADASARKLLGPSARALQLVEAARSGDDAAAAAMAEIGRRLGTGIGSLVNVFNPEVVVLGGGFAAAADLLLGPAHEALALEALSPGRELVRIVLAELGPEAGLVGAGLVAFEALDAAA